MKKIWKYAAIGALIAVVAILSCTKEETPSGGGGTQGLSVVALVNAQQALVYVGNGPSAYTGALVMINNDTLEYSPVAKAYYSANVKYQKGTKYVLYVDADTLGTLIDSLTAPANLEGVHVTSPQDGAQLPKNQAITVTWAYDGSNEDGYAGISFKYDDEDTSRYYTYPPLAGTNTSDVVPASVVNKDGDASVYAWAGIYKEYTNLASPDPYYGDRSGFFVGINSSDVDLVIGEGGGGGGGVGEWSGSWTGTIYTSYTPPDSLVVTDGAFDGYFDEYQSGDTTYLTGTMSIWYSGNIHLAVNSTAYGLIKADSVVFSVENVEANGYTGTMVFTGTVSGNGYSGIWVLSPSTPPLPFGQGQWSGGPTEKM